jgi:hypothetical protein
MKLRFERGALADLDDILSYIASDSRRQQRALPHGSNRRQCELPRLPTWASNQQIALQEIASWQLFDRI